MILLLSMIFLVSFGMYSTPKLANAIHYFHSHTKLSNEFLLISIYYPILYLSQIISGINTTKFGFILISLHLKRSQRLKWH